MPPPRSLKARALQWLAQREQSRFELRRKLIRHARAEAVGEAGSVGVRGAAGVTGSVGANGSAEVDNAVDAAAGVDAIGVMSEADADVEARVEALLDWLEAHRYLSSERFVESRVHARSARFGNLRIRQELRQHQLVLPTDAAAAMRETELQRADAVRARQFTEWPANPSARARQARFLAGRGFSPDVIGRLLRRAANGSEPSDG